MHYLIKPPRIKGFLAVSALGLLPSPLLADSLSEPSSDVMLVTASPHSWWEPDEQSEKEKLENVAGGTNLVIADKDTRLATLQDALDYQPGIVVQNFFGGTDQPRLNIRGSGVQSAPLSRGVLLMQDGLPATDADGSFHISTLEMRDARMISVRRGANSLSLQSNSLGGELDLLSRTGRDENGRLRYEYGSFGREGMQTALGGVTEDGRFDGRINLAYDHFDGYRKHSTSQRKTVRSNLGYVSDNVVNRTWLGWTDLRFDVAGSLSENALNDDPTEVNPTVWLRDPHRSVQQFRAANRTDWQMDNHRLSLGVWYLRTHDNFTTPTNYRFSNYHSEGAQIAWDVKTNSATWRAALALDHMALDVDLMQNRRGTRMDKTPLGRFDGQAENIYASLGTDLYLTPDLTFNLDIKTTHARRDVDKRNSNVSLDQGWTFWTPKAGVIWRPTYRQRYFANISASQEPATFREIINTSDGRLIALSPQKNLTFEVGGEGEFSDSLKWDLALYRSIIKDECITTYNADGTAIGIYNYAAKTRHQGLEMGLKGNIPVGPGNAEYRLSWTYNDFRFMGGEYNGKFIAGIPRNTIAAEVLYRIGDWRFGPNLHWSPTDMAVDHENHLGIQKRRHYAILGFKGSYQTADTWSLYLSLDNLTNERYATASVARRNVSEKDSTLFPGMGFNVNAGMTYTF